MTMATAALAASNQRLADQAATNISAAKANADFTQVTPYIKQVSADLQKGDYANAWSIALSTSGIYGTNYDSVTKDPLLQAMESTQGLAALTPGKKWTQADDTAFYTALQNNPVAKGQTTKSPIDGSVESLGQNPYGTWGDISKFGSDATSDYQTSTGAPPDIERFAGARPSENFFQKWGLPIVAVIAAIVAPYAIPAIAAVVGGGVAATVAAGAVYGAAATAVGDAVAGKQITLTGELVGAVGGAAAGASLAGAGVGSTVSNGVASVTGQAVGSVGNSVISGAITGALGTAAGDVITGQPLTAGSVAEGAAAGAAGAAAGDAAKSLAGDAGVTNSTALNLIGKAAAGLAAGAVGKIAGASVATNSAGVVTAVNGQASTSNVGTSTTVIPGQATATNASGQTVGLTDSSGNPINSAGIVLATAAAVAAAQAGNAKPLTQQLQQTGSTFGGNSTPSTWVNDGSSSVATNVQGTTGGVSGTSSTGTTSTNTLNPTVTPSTWANSGDTSIAGNVQGSIPVSSTNQNSGYILPAASTAASLLNNSSSGSTMADSTDTSTGTDLGSLASTVGNGLITAENQSLQNSLITSAVGTLQSFASSVASQNNPDLTAYINTQAKLVQQGQITPAAALSAVQAKSQMYGIQVPQEYTDATNNALKQEQQIATQGYTPVERAAIQNALQGVITQQNGQEAAIKASAETRGQYGSGQQLDQMQNTLQGEVNNASSTANQTEANAFNRALAAIQGSGTLGLSAGQQSFNQQGSVAQAQDAINNTNAQLTQQSNLANTTNQQAAAVLKSNQDLAVQEGNLAQVNNLNQQEVAAANQTQQNKLSAETLAGNSLAAAGKDAASIEAPVYANAQAGQAALNKQLGSALTGAGGSGGGGGGTTINSPGDPGVGDPTINTPTDSSTISGLQSTTGQTGNGLSGGINGSGFYSQTAYDEYYGVNGYSEGGEVGANKRVKGFAVGGLVGTVGENTAINNRALSGLTPRYGTVARPAPVASNPIASNLVTRGTIAFPHPAPVASNPLVPTPVATPPHMSTTQPLESPETNGYEAPTAVNPYRRNTQPVQMGARSLSSGGAVHGPGTEKSDSIPAYLSNHEFVINADSTHKYKPVLEAINDDEDEHDVLSKLLPIAASKAPTSGVIVAKSNKPIDGQKALSLALQAIANKGKK